MIAVRAAMLLVAVMVLLAALGATDAGLRSSELRLAVAAMVGLLAPLFWPGSAATPARTALRIAAWSAAAACLAAVALRMPGQPAQPLPRILGTCAMLMAILLVTHALAAVLEGLLRVRSADAEAAREVAGRAAAGALALLGSLPLWLGPAAELLAARHAWIVDTVVGISPLTHLAVASHNDLLRNQWFYQHANLAGLQVSYPGLDVLAWCYGTACLVLALIALASLRSRRVIDHFARA